MKINTFLSFFCTERIIFWEGNILSWGRKNDSFKLRGVYFQQCWITESLWFLPTGRYSEIQKTHSYPFPIKHSIILIQHSLCTHMELWRTPNWILPSLQNHGKERTKGKWKKSNIYGNTRCILNISLSEPLYF